jgi:predicted O-methyltransferase YrrM
VALAFQWRSTKSQQPADKLLGRRWRRLRLGLSTLFGRKPSGFFIPYRHADTAASSRYTALEALLDQEREKFAQLLAELGPLPTRPRLARWDQDWFSGLDAAMAYAFVRKYRPRRILEVGSGHSTRFMAEAIADSDLATKLTTIDPMPRASIAGTRATLVRVPVPDCGEAPFAELGSGDILFVDSSHVLMPGTDVDYLLNRILPNLPVGTLVHFHDVFLPEHYPAGWAWRGYNEQLGVATLLLGGAWRVLFSSHYAETRMPNEVAASAVGSISLVPSARPSSLWLERSG